LLFADTQAHNLKKDGHTKTIHRVRTATNPWNCAHKSNPLCAHHTGHPLHAWRLTPSKETEANCTNGLGSGQKDDAFPLPEVVSRFPDASTPKSSATGVAPDSGMKSSSGGELERPEVQDEHWLQPAMDWLLDALQKEWVWG